MDLFKLTSTFYPGPTITKFDTLIWRERFREAGDFVIQSTNDLSALEALPLGSFISHSDTGEAMIVENHEIVRQKDKTLKITISGRSAEVLAEDRSVLGTNIQLINAISNQQNETVLTGTPEDIAALLLRRGLQRYFTLYLDDWIPNLAVRQEIVTMDSSREISIQRGDVYSAVIPLLATAAAGLKIVRPSGAQTTLDIVVHDGINRSSTVSFYAQQEDLVDATYFWSIKGYKNTATVNTKSSWRVVQDRAIVPTLTGLDRRVMYVAAADIEGTFPSPTTTDVLASRGQLALDERRKLQILSATISETARPKFKLNYDVGDLVTVLGEFSTSSVMRVTEHITTVDAKGVRGYPSLSTV